jgi:hypothetical protein
MAGTIYLDINALVGLNPDDQFVAHSLTVENVTGNILVLNAHL